jgi:hypothetical protein
VRLGLRWFLKPTSRPGVTVIRRREQIITSARGAANSLHQRRLGAVGGLVPALLQRGKIPLLLSLAHG